MPIIDSQTGSLTLRVVYDGQPQAGKTTSVRALSERVRGTKGFTTPAESNGRTLYFDWLEFHGGEFGGREIRVQVISVPGQLELRHRRDYLIEQADAVVFVADSRAEQFQQSLELFEALVSVTRRREPPVGVIVQANKQDEPNALPISVMREMLRPYGRVTLIDTIATNGEGIREAFAMALRAALDRAQFLADVGELVVSDLEIRTADQLLDTMQNLESGVQPSVPAWSSEAAHELEQLEPVTRWEDPVRIAPSVEVLFTPDACLPSGYIWPPVDGRAIVHEASSAGIVPVRAGSGDWWASTGGWRFHSLRDATHADSMSARSHLVRWARLHALCSSLLSPDRALLLASAGPSQYRLWQLVRIFPSLRERLLEDLFEPARLAEVLLGVGRQLVCARREVARLGVNLRCTLWTIGEGEQGRPMFVGLMPSPREAAAPELEWRTLIHRELTPTLRALSNDELDVLVFHLGKTPSELSAELVRVVRAVQAAGSSDAN